MAPASFFGLEHFTYFAVPLALAAIGLLPPLWVGLAFALKAVGDASLYAAYTGERPRPMDVLVLPLKEIVLLGAWLAACFGREITWRQRTLRVEAGGAYTFAPASLASQDAKVISDPQ
jgi:hypothetical protein